MDGIHKSIFLWGVICLFGFGAYQFFLMNPSFPKPMDLWVVLTVIGVVAMVKWVPNWQKNKTVQVWLVIGVGGMLYHLAFINKMLPAIIPSAWAYWALLMAVGFILTAYFWKDNFWYYVGAVNALAFLAVFFAPGMVGEYASGLLAVVSGLPMIYNGYFTK